jgi:hypothetical protein
MLMLHANHSRESVEDALNVLAVCVIAAYFVLGVLLCGVRAHEWLEARRWRRACEVVTSTPV